MNLEAPFAGALASPLPQLDISHHVTEDLILTPEDNAPPDTDTTTPARSGILARLFGSSGTRQQDMHITERRQLPGRDAVPSSPSDEQRLLQLQNDTDAAAQRMVISRMETEMAELDARKAAAEAALAESHQRTRAWERESAGNLGTSPSPSPPRARRSPRSSPSPTTEVAALLQLFQMQQQQAADQRREERREDRREAAEREERLEARIAEREARLEARLLQPPSAAAARLASESNSGFRSNKAFDTLPLFSGANNQPFRSWNEEFVSIAGIVGVHHDNLRELRLKLTGPARAHYYGRYTDQDEPTLKAAMAHLSSEFGAKYEESKLWADVYQFKRKPGSPGKDVTRTLAANRQKMLAAGIPTVRSEAEDIYYLHELSLTTAQLAVFLAQLSGRADASDARLKRLTGAPDETRRESLMPALTSSDERTALFTTRLSLIVAFLDHDPGEPPGHGGTARAAATSGLTDDTSGPPPPARLPPPPQTSTTPTTRAAMVLALKAHWDNRRAREGPAPRFHGPRQGENTEYLSRNAATFAERQANQWCFGCTPEQLAKQGPIPHWECKHHGQDASEADRSIRVPGSGRSQRRY